MNTVLIGTAERPITPPLGCSMAGYFEPHQAEEIVTGLFARAFAARQGDAPPVALVCCDVLALEASSAARIRSACARQADIPEANICVSATHTHTGPQTADIFGHPAEAEYLAYLESQVAAAVVEAVRSLRPATLRMGRVEEDRASCNRRVVLRDGTVHTHTTDADIPEVAGREGPADQEMLTLHADWGDGTPGAVLVNFALHPTNVRGDRICFDYPGYFVKELRARRGEDLCAVFVNGACGNIDSKTGYLANVAYGPGRAQRIAEVLAEAAQAALTNARPLELGPVAVLTETIAVPRKQISPERVAQARALLAQEPAAEADPSTLVFTRGTRRPSVLKERVYAAEALYLADLYTREPMAPVEIQAMRIGELAIVTVPVELFCEFGLEIKRLGNQRFAHTMVIELANGYLGYVPTRKSFVGGGYETRDAKSSQLAPEAGDLIVQAADRLLARLV